ncbi:EF-P 5-aminopentanol modification-associated protein YfmF [Streptococcus timonensis]|uniref:EF-P 5-aminopentanol modification-associated protein YfmF n=1 Tax=Streptococcus timonensis TaxID=1852387 RepID=UPI0039C2FE96
MELVPGIAVHFIQSKKFKTNKITVRFTAPLSLELISSRMINASILETANQIYPSAQLLKKRLAGLYGADLSSQAYRRGQSHLVDVSLTYVRDEFLSKKNVLTSQILELLNQILFSPLANAGEFEQNMFEIEQKQLIARLESELEDPFFFAHKELDQLYFQEPAMQLVPKDLISRISKETPKSSFSSFQKMLKEDKVDIFFLGDFNEIEIREHLEKYSLTARQQVVKIQYHQPYSNILNESFLRKNLGQSILEMGYHSSIGYGDEGQLAMLLVNGLLGAFPHSKLFTEVREKEALAYTVSSHLDLFSGRLRLFAGIDRKNRNKVRKLMNEQLVAIKKGEFSDIEIHQTKKMIKRSLLLSKDNQDSIIDREYLSQFFGKLGLDIHTLIEKLEQVEKDEICEVAGSLRLQAIYFMEGLE